MNSSNETTIGIVADARRRESAPALRSQLFRAEREANWRELETLLALLDGGQSARKLSPEALLRLPVLYRAALSSLSVARAISLDANLLRYLESLATRAHLMLHGRRRPPSGAFVRYFMETFPRSVRSISGVVLFAIALIAAGVIAGYALTAEDADHFFAFVDEGLAKGRTPWANPEDLRLTLYDSAEGYSLEAFAFELFVRNAGIGLLSIMIGVIGGVFVALLLFVNGAMLGAMWAAFANADLGLEFAAWVLPHGVTELLAIALCGAAGLALGRALLFPGAMTRLDALAAVGPRVGRVALGAMLLFAIAAVIEGLFRQQVQDLNIRLLVFGGTLVAWLTYFIWAGRTGGAHAVGARR